MNNKKTLQKEKLLDQLQSLQFEKKETEEAFLDEMSLARSLLKLAGIDNEQEFKLCQTIARRLLKELPSSEGMESI